MKAESKRYFIRVQKILVEVTGEVYTAYYEMERKEKYLLERDKSHGLLYYDGWDTETSNGVDFINKYEENIRKTKNRIREIEGLIQAAFKEKFPVPLQTLFSGAYPKNMKKNMRNNKKTEPFGNGI